MQILGINSTPPGEFLQRLGLVKDRFCELADHSSFSPKMRAKFQEVAEQFSDWT
jgi:hypothetical protein